MSDLVAFLRAINVGGRQAKNADLRAAFERMGYSEVETFIASGNVIFSVAARPSAALEQKIERTLEKAFDLEITTFSVTRGGRRHRRLRALPEGVSARLALAVRDPGQEAVRARGVRAIEALETKNDGAASPPEGVSSRLALAVRDPGQEAVRAGGGAAPSKRSKPKTIGSPCTDARCTGCAARSRPTRS